MFGRWLKKAAKVAIKEIAELDDNGQKGAIEAITNSWQKMLDRNEERTRELELKKEISNGGKDKLINELTEERRLLEVLLRKYETTMADNWALRERQIFNEIKIEELRRENERLKNR